MAELYPWSRSYLDVYDHYGLLRPRAVYAHCIHLDAADRQRMAATGAAMSFCATSNLFLGSGLFDVRGGAGRPACAWASAPTSAAARACRMLRTLDESYKVCQLAGQTLSPLRAFYLATLGGAAALYLDERIGNFAVGKEADFVVLDPAATPLLARRMARTTTLAEKLFAFMIMGDDRAVHATHVLGSPAHMRTHA